MAKGILSRRGYVSQSIRPNRAGSVICASEETRRQVAVCYAAQGTSALEMLPEQQLRVAESVGQVQRQG